MEQVRRSQKELEEKATEVKKVLSNKYGTIKLDRTKADISKKQLQLQTDQDISLARASLDKQKDQDLSQFDKQLQKEQVALLKKAFTDQRALYDRIIAQDRSIANAALQKTREKNEESIKKLQKTIDSFNDDARALVQELDNHRFNLKIQIYNLIRVNAEVPDEIISMPRWYFDRAVDNYCAPHLAMKFKVFKMRELYNDLEKYDQRASFGEFAIEGSSVQFHKFIEALSYQGYMFDAEVYYLNPGTGNKPSTDLVRIVGEVDVQQMVRAHAEQGTKICLLYLVSRYEYQDTDDVMIDSSESDEEPDQTSNAHVEPNTLISHSGDEGQQSGGADNP